MTKLSVNINKVATIRNSRGGNIPDVAKVAHDCERFGAQGITVHPRPDERHIRYRDVYEIKTLIKTELNIEGNPSQRFIELVTDIKPAQVTLVPDDPDALTSNRGWNVEADFDKLAEIVGLFRSKGIRTSIFVETDLKNIACAAKTGVDRIELYTGPYAENYAKSREDAIAPFIEAANLAKELGLRINAGHDLCLPNLGYFVSQIPFIDEVSIGHALICDALYYGLEKRISMYNECIKQNRK
ncbi:MAG: pyridoxine 5'-phosphate synthase [Tannerella sp.]|jgi:pyridoxine 5-phosphate synthase|nr:pyridoxine 5'-phosphate synthase [Tannerella sp.]